MATSLATGVTVELNGSVVAGVVKVGIVRVVFVAIVDACCSASASTAGATAGVTAGSGAVTVGSGAVTAGSADGGARPSPSVSAPLLLNSSKSSASLPTSALASSTLWLYALISDGLIGRPLFNPAMSLIGFNWSAVSFARSPAS